MGWYNCYDYVKHNGHNARPYVINDGTDIDTLAEVLYHGDAVEFFTDIGGITGAYTFPRGTYESLGVNQRYNIETANGAKIYMLREYQLGQNVIRIGYNLTNDNTDYELFSTSSWPSYWANALISVMFFYESSDKTTLRALIVSSNDEGYSAWRGSVYAMPKTLVDEITYGVEFGEDPYQTAPDSEPDGGFGDFDYSGDPVLPPDLPTISVVDSGFVTLYKPTIAQLRALASYMWSGLFDVSAFKKIFADPMDCIISLSIIPIDAPAGTPQELKVGNIGTGININVLSEQFVKVKFATKNIGLRANNFADYSPYTKCQLFLPYVGCQSLNIDDIAGADIDIEYHIDLFSGACTAYVNCSKRNSDGSPLHSTMYQFTGNVIANIPFTATNFQSFISSVIGTVVKTGAAAATGGGAAIAGAAGSAINTAMSMKPDVERSGNLSSTSGFLGIQKPYLILTYPNLCIPDNRDKTVGTPSFIGLGMQSGYGNKKLSDFHGLTIMHKVNVKNIPCTEAEKEMIAAQLTGEGVIMP